jgi:group I intron endonuclease
MIGIYCITNKINGKKYIGQSWDIERRWKRHRSNVKKPNDVHLYSAFTKYGIENFSFEVIREVKENAITQILLDCYEDKYIKQFDTLDRNKGYNKRTGGSYGRLSEETKLKMSEAQKGNKNWLGHKHTEETKLKISAGNKGKNVGKSASEETREKMSESQKGRHHSEETKRKIGESHRGEKNCNYGKSLPKKTKQKMSESRKGKKLSEETKRKLGKKVICLETQEIFNSLRDAEKKYNIAHESISACCRGKLKSAGKLDGKKLHWNYSIEEGA